MLNIKAGQLKCITIYIERSHGCHALCMVKKVIVERYVQRFIGKSNVTKVLQFPGKKTNMQYVCTYVHTYGKLMRPNLQNR